jgi:uncharacterized Fe-S cluster protein YjdI
MNAPIDYKSKIAVRYKTEICKNWESGYCEFGEKCVFAHGAEEIRGKSFYKTKKCKYFFENGYCMFGNKCIFKHLENSSSSPEGVDNQNTMKISDKKENTQQASYVKSRLPIFQQISQFN